MSETDPVVVQGSSDDSDTELQPTNKRRKTGDSPVEKMLKTLSTLYIGKRDVHIMSLVLASMDSMTYEALRKQISEICGPGECRWGSQLIVKNDIESLLRGAWLNDNTLNMILCIITRSLGLQYSSIPAGFQFLDRNIGCIPGANCIVVNTYFYSTVFPKSGGMDTRKLQGCFKHTDTSQVNRIGVPIHLGDAHWLVAVIDVGLGKVIVCDSLGIHNQKTDLYERIANQMIDIYKELWKVKNPTIPIRTEWTIDYNTQSLVQQQEDGSNCGVWVVMNLLFLMQGKRVVPIWNKDMPNARKWIAQQLLDFWRACAQEPHRDQ